MRAFISNCAACVGEQCIFKEHCDSPYWTFFESLNVGEQCIFKEQNEAAQTSTRKG